MTVRAPSSVTEQDVLVRSVAAHGLAGSMLDFPSEPLDTGEFALLLAHVRMQRLTGLLWRAITDGALPVTPGQAEHAEWLHVQALSATLVLERLLLQTVDRLDAAGVPVRVLKGSAHGHLDYPVPEMRTFGDIDLLVPGEGFDRAVKTLLAEGHSRIHPEPRPGFDRRFSKGTSFRTRDDLEIDLHRSLSMGPFGVRLDLRRMWESYDEFWLGGRSLRALATEERFLHACYHAVLGNVRPRLAALRDVAQIALTKNLDLARLHTLVRSSGGEAVISRAVRSAWNEFDIADILAISAWANAYRADRRQMSELAAYGRGSSYATKSFAAIRALPSVSERAAFVYALVVPTRSYVAQRHRGRIDRLRTGLRQRTGMRSTS